MKYPPKTVVLTSLAMVAVLGGCASTPSASSSSASNIDGSPGSIAVAYMGNIFSDHPMAAEPLILPSGRGTFRALATIIEQKHVTGRDFAAGATTVNGNHATVTITGTMCPNDATVTPTADATVGSVSPSTPAGPRCVTNTDPNSTNKGFQVALQKSTDGKWYSDIPR